MLSTRFHFSWRARDSGIERRCCAHGFSGGGERVVEGTMGSLFSTIPACLLVFLALIVINGEPCIPHLWRDLKLPPDKSHVYFVASGFVLSDINSSRLLSHCNRPLWNCSPSLFNGVLQVQINTW